MRPTCWRGSFWPGHSAGLVDSTIRNDINHLELVRDWFGRPLWEMQPADADAYFGKVLRDAKPSTRAGRAAAVTVFFQFLELRHKVELHNLTGRVVECPLDEINRPRMSADPQLRIPPAAGEIEQLFAGWREELAACRKFAPAARNYAAARLEADVGLRVNEVRMLDLDDVRWELGRFGAQRPAWQGIAPQGAQAAAGAADQRRRPQPALVHRGRVGPVRRRPRAARRPAVPVRAQEPGRLVRPGDRRCVPPVAGRRRQPAPARLVREADPPCPAALCSRLIIVSRLTPEFPVRLRVSPAAGRVVFLWFRFVILSFFSVPGWESWDIGQPAADPRADAGAGR